MSASLPADPDAERAVLSCLLQDPTLVTEAAAQIEKKAFYQFDHRLVYEALTTMAEAREDIDAIMLQAKLRELGTYDKVNGGKLVGELLGDVPTVAMYPGYVDTIQRHYRNRSIWESCSEIRGEALQPDADPGNLAQMLDADLTSILDRGTSSASVTWAEATAQLVGTIEKRFADGGKLPGMDVGIEDINGLINGLQPEYYILAARPSTGKTSLAGQWATTLAQAGHGVGIISLETTAERLVQRAISFRARIHAGRLEYGRLDKAELNRFKQAAQEFTTWPIHINDTPGMRIKEIDAQVRHWVKEDGIKALFIDYLQLAETNDQMENEQRETTEKSKFFKNLVSRYNIPVVCLAQLNRGPETGNRRPKPSDLRSSGSIEQDADVICMLHRLEPDAEDDNPDDADFCDTDFMVVKGRNCGVGETRLTFQKSLTAFSAANYRA